MTDLNPQLHSAQPSQSDLVLSTDLSVTSCMSDMHQRMRASWLFRLFQEISIQHTIALGVDRTKTLDRGLLWVISRQSVTIHRMPAYDEAFRLSTWPGKTLEILFPRYYSMQSLPDRTGIRQSDESRSQTESPAFDDNAGRQAPSDVIVEGEAFWLLMDQRTRSFAFPEEYGIAIPESPLVPDDQPFPKPLRCPKGMELLPFGTYMPRYSQIDLNGHVNNANYYDIIDDLEAPEQTIRIPHHIDAEYRNEIRPGTAVRIFRGISSNDSIRYYEGYPADQQVISSRPSGSNGRHPVPMFRILLQF